MSQYPVAQVVGGQQGGVVGVVSQPSDVNLDIGGRVEKMQNELDVPEQIVRDLLSVAGADIVVIADDSGSMGAVANYVTRSTRWTESGAVWKPNVGRPTPATRRGPGNCGNSPVDSTQVARHAPEARAHAARRGPHGRLPHPVPERSHVRHDLCVYAIDATFTLSTRRWHEIHSGSQVETLFYGRQPKGRTPLATRLRPLLSGQWHPKGHGAETDLILLIMTDGEPSDCSFSELRQLVGQKSPKVFCTFMMCTEEDDVVEQYNKSLDRLPGVDITDDYVSKRRRWKSWATS